MRVRVVLLRTTGVKLTRAELAQAKHHDGELFITDGMAILCDGRLPQEYPTHGRAIPPLYDAKVPKLRGDDFVITGRNLRDCVYVHVECVQAWWCRVLRPSAS